MWIKAGSKAERGLPANWEAIRAAVLRRDRYLCRCSECQTNGRVRTASEVDHVVPRAEGIRRGWTLAQINAMTNLAAINPECHKLKSVKEMGQSRRPRIGIDGYPIAE
jgi:5-methylcytosine-specific restriction protein A